MMEAEHLVRILGLSWNLESLESGSNILQTKSHCSGLHARLHKRLPASSGPEQGKGSAAGVACWASSLPRGPHMVEVSATGKDATWGSWQVSGQNHNSGPWALEARPDHLQHRPLGVM